MSAAKSRTTWGVLLVVVAIAIAAATLLRGSTEANTEVRLHKAEKRGVTARVLAQGKVKAKAQVDVSSEVAGRVAVVNVEVGDVVKVGDLLFSLDGEQLRNAVEQIGAALAAAEALLARADVGVKEAERAVERDQKLADKGVVTDDVLKLGESRLAGARADRAQANANVERARIDLNRAKDALRRAKVTAPQAGTVVAVGVEVGRVVSSTTGLSASPDASLGLGIGGVSAPVVIADLSELMVRLDVDELDVARLRVGQRAVVRAQGIKSAEFEGTVERVGLMGRDVMGAVLFVVDVKVTGVRPPSTKSASTSTSPSPSTPSPAPPASLPAPPRCRAETSSRGCRSRPRPAPRAPPSRRACSPSPPPTKASPRAWCGSRAPKTPSAPPSTTTPSPTSKTPPPAPPPPSSWSPRAAVCRRVTSSR